MTASYVQLPADGSGRKIRTRSRTVGSDTVHEQYIQALTHERVLTTRLWYHSGRLTVGASADTSNVGRVYIENDPDSTVVIAITRVRFASQLGSALATPTCPRFVLRYFTFTGNTPSGTQITGVEQDTSYGAKSSNWDVRTTDTGMTITEGADACSFFVTAGATAVGYAPPAVAEWVSEPDRPLIIRAGQGYMLKQADNGTTSDTRVVTADFEIEEFTEV